MQAVVKKVVYSFRYRLGAGQVGREVFHIVLIPIPNLSGIFHFVTTLKKNRTVPVSDTNGNGKSSEFSKLELVRISISLLKASSYRERKTW